MVNNAVMQLVDRAFLARESMSSLEAALPASILAFNVLGFFHSAIAYSGTFVAQYHGAGNPRMARMSYRAGTLLSIVFGAVALLFVPVGSALLGRFTSSPDVLVRELAYYRVVMAGGVFLLLQMAAMSYFTGLGRTRPVFWVNVLGNVFNAALDPVLIFGLFGCPRLGIAGAAYATVAATALQWIALAVLARGLGGGGPAGRPAASGAFMPELLPLVGRILRFGVPSGAYTALNLSLIHI